MKPKASMKFGCRIFLRAHESFNNIVERARFCEKYGFDSVLVDDHILYGTESASAPDPFTTLAAVGSQTKRITVGVAVTDLVRRNPAILAQTAATLSSILPGRFFLGLGAGDPMNQTPIGLSSKNRFGILQEGIGVMKMLWSSSIQKPVNYRGRFFTLKRAYVQTGEEKPPPIYLAAFGPRMLKFAGELADGWIPHCHTPKTYRKDLETISHAAHRVQRSLRAFVPAYYTVASVSENRDEADRRVLGPAKYFLALIPEGLKKVDPSVKHPGHIWEKLPHPRQQREAIRRIAAEIPDKPALDIAIHGTPEDCIEQIEEYRRSGCQELMLTFVPSEGLWSTKGLATTIRLFSTRVIGHFK